MYPLIMAFLAAGLAASYIVGPHNSILSILVAFAPFFMLPFAFRLTTGIMGTISGGTQKAFSGGFIRLKKQRQEILATNRQALLAGQRYRGSNALSRRARDVGGGFGAFMASGDKLHYFNKETRDAARQTHQDMVMGAYGKRPEIIATQNNKDMLRAGTYLSQDEARTGLESYMRDVEGVTDEDQIKTRVGRAAAAVENTGGYSRVRQQYSTMQLAAAAGYKDLKDTTGTIVRVSHGNREVMDSLIGSTRSISERAGRPDLKPGFGTMQQLVYDQAGIGGGEKPTDARYTAASIEAAFGTDNATLVRSKPASVENMFGALAKGLDPAQIREVVTAGMTRKAGETDADYNGRIETAASQLRGQILAKARNVQGAASWGPEVNMVAFNKALDEAGRDFATTRTMVEPQPGFTRPIDQVAAKALHDTLQRPTTYDRGHEEQFRGPEEPPPGSSPE